MQTQLYLCPGVYDSAHIMPVSYGDGEHGRSIAVKPYGGLWTSTYAPATGSAWVDWCYGNDVPEWIRGKRWYLLEPDSCARIAIIDTLEALTQLIARYERHPYDYLPDMQTIDFVAMAADGWHGLHLTERGQVETRMSEPNLYGWDCESTLWLRPAFRSVHEIAPLEVSADA